MKKKFLCLLLAGVIMPCGVTPYASEPTVFESSGSFGNGGSEKERFQSIDESFDGKLDSELVEKSVSASANEERPKPPVKHITSISEPIKPIDEPINTLKPETQPTTDAEYQNNLEEELEPQEQNLTRDYGDTIGASAGDDVRWKYENGTFTISGNGKIRNFTENNQPWSNYKTSITEIVIGEGVKNIGAFMFANCTSLKSITIPANIESLDQAAFIGCSSLSEVNFASNGNLKNIGQEAFEDCVALTSIEIPKSVGDIGYGAFLWCYNLANITFESGSCLKTLGNYAFYQCSELTGIIIPDSVEGIGYAAFSGCQKLTSVNIATNSNLKILDEWAFFDCVALTSINIPANLTEIKKDAFNGCSKLATVTFDAQSTLQTLSEGVFWNCASLNNITIPSTVTEIGKWALGSCAALTSITIPANVTSIGQGAFQNCGELTSINIPNKVTQIGQMAFSGCSKLSAVTFSETINLQILDKWTFENCAALESITIPNSVKTIEQSAFLNCSKLGTINFGVATSNLETLGNYAFSGCEELESITIPNSVKTIEQSAFYNCKKLSTVTFGSGSQSKLETLNNFAFYNCEALTSINIPDSVTTIGQSAFWNCKKLATVTFSNQSKLQTLGGYAFKFCEALTSIDIPNGVTKIPIQAFYKCYALTSITIPNDVTDIGNYAFYQCGVLESITISNNVTGIGEAAFSGCSKFATVTFSDQSKLQTLGDWAFENCETLKSIEIPDSVKYINQSAFLNCKSLEKVTFCEQSQLEFLDKWAFDSCEALTSIAIPDGVTEIPQSAFRLCENLKSIYIPDSVTTIGDWVFYKEQNDINSLKVYFEGDESEWNNISKGNDSQLPNLEENIIYNARYVRPHKEPHNGGTIVVKNNIRAGELLDNQIAFMGDEITLTAQPNEKYIFGGWYVSNKLETTNAEYEFTMPDENVGITAKFIRKTESVKPSDKVGYIVEHYKTGEPVERERLFGKIGETAEAKPKEYAGYTFNPNANETVLSGDLKKIESEKDIVTLKLYYWKNVAFELKANGGDNEATTELTLTFDKPVDGLTADDLIVTGDAKKGKLTGDGKIYKLAISDITKDKGVVTVEVKKEGYAFKPQSQTVEVRKYVGGSSGGGGGGSTTTTDKDKTTETKPNGVTTETKPNGDKVTTEIRADGVTIETTIKPNGETSSQITAPSGQQTTVDIPTNFKEDGTVSVVIKDENGKRTENVKVTNGKLSLNIQGNAQITILDNFTPLAALDIQLPFTDVKETDWFYEAVKYAYANGVMNGVTETLFAPNDTTTRAMLVTVLWRYAGEPKATATNEFTDVDANEYYADAVNWANANGIVLGYDGKTFAPNDTITREQFATVLYRYLQTQGGGFKGDWSYKLNFTDADQISDYAYEAMSYFAMSGVINGKGNNILDPKGNITRAETAKMLMKFDESQ